MTKRILFNFLLLGAIFYTPWLVVVIIAFAGAFLFPFYYEIIVAGVFFDLLYGISANSVNGSLGLIVAMVLFIAARRFRRAVR